MNKNAKTIADRAAVAPTELHKHFAEWLEAQTGIKVDEKTVQLACIFRMDFQASDENQAVLKAKKAAAAAAKKASAAKKKARLEAELAKLTGKTAEVAPTEETPEAPVAEEKAEELDTTPVKMTIIYGGNEPEVHKFGCADAKKKTAKMGFSKETVSFHSHTEITEHIYSPEEFGADSVEMNYMAYNALPCVGKLNS